MKCVVKYCRRTPQDGSKCNTCKSRERRKAKPLESAFQALKDNAKRRGKEFTLTLQQFRTFAVATDYIAGRGRRSDSYHVDRVDESKGYTVDNIQVLTNKDNGAKYRSHLRYSKDQLGVPYEFWTENYSLADYPAGDGVPF